MKPLATTFDSKGFHFQQLLREQDVAVFEKRRILDNATGELSKQNISYELVRVQKYPDYQIAGVTVPAHEALPPSSKWGEDGLTFTDQMKAMDTLMEWVKTNPITAISGQATGAPRGRKPSGFILNVPTDRTFLMSDLIALYPDTPRPTLVVKLAELEKAGKVKRIGTQRSATGRGKPCVQYQAQVS
jgi:hypothetical protein